MANLRVVYNNVANQSNGLSASTTAGTLTVANLLTEVKTEVWRSTGTSATLTLTWASAATFNAAVLAFSNLSSTATMQVAVYAAVGDASPFYTSAATLCCPTNFGIAAPVGFGGGVYASLWFPAKTGSKLVITITDSSNANGYIQAGRLIVGNYWSPERNAESDSVKITMQDDSKNSRSESGSLWTDRGPMYKKLSFDLTYMTAADRNSMWRIIAGNGVSNSVFVSVMPESTDSSEEQIHSIYGRIASSSSLQYRYLHLHATQLQLEEI